MLLKNVDLRSTALTFAPTKTSDAFSGTSFSWGRRMGESIKCKIILECQLKIRKIDALVFVPSILLII